MNAKRLIMSLGMLVFVGAAVVGGTGAFFSDTETSTGNTFTAGEVDLTIDDVNHDGNPEVGFLLGEDGKSFSFADLKPLDEGTITYDLTNEDNQAYVCVLVENATTNPEANDTALANFMSFLFAGDSGTVATVAGEWQSLGVFNTDQTQNLAVDYCFGTYNGTECVLDDVEYNDAQGGQMVLDLEFYAVQTRNNPNFVCSDLNEIVAEGPTDGWNGPGALIAQAEGRFGNGDTGSVQTWELGVGNNTQNANSNNTQFTWTNGATYPFTVSYDAGSDVMTFDVNGTSVTYNVGAITSTADLNIVAGKVSSGSGDNVELTNLKLNGTNINPGSLVDTDNTDAKYLVVNSVDLSGGFVMTGNVEFNWTPGTTSGSRPAFQVQVRD